MLRHLSEISRALVTAAREIHRPSLSALYYVGVTANGEENVRSLSTTWEWRRVKIASPPPRPSASPKAATKWWHLTRWNGRKSLTIRIVYRGGPQCWYEVESRGSRGRFPGVTALHDVMSEVYGGDRRSS